MVDGYLKQGTKVKSHQDGKFGKRSTQKVPLKRGYVSFEEGTGIVKSPLG